MKKNIQIYSVLLLFVFLASCKGQDRTDQLNENISQKESVLRDSIYAIQEVDTIFTPNAPSRITRKIRKDKEGNLLFATYDDIIRYDGTSFTNFTKEEGLDSYDAFDVKADCVDGNTIEVFQVLQHNTALANIGERFDDVIVLLVNYEGKTYYDEQEIIVPKGQCAKQIGLYEYRSKDERDRTVPVVAIEAE